MKKTLLALALLVPALAVGQEKYTNADLNRAPRKDAYTNADLARLAPLPVGKEVKLQPLPQVLPDAAAEARATRRTILAMERERIETEMAYWNGVIEKAGVFGHSTLAWPRFGSDTAEARQRLKALDRALYLVNARLALHP